MLHTNAQLEMTDEFAGQGGVGIYIQYTQPTADTNIETISKNFILVTGVPEFSWYS